MLLIMQIEGRGTRPLLMHNVQLASPMNPFAKKLREINSKKAKTEEDREAMARIEFEGGIYHDPELGPFIPAENLLASITAGARLTRGGRKIERGVTMMDFMMPLIYDGPRDVEGLWNDPSYVDIRSVKVQTARVDRCRPIFSSWGFSTRIAVDTAVVEEDEIRSFVAAAGQHCGLGDYRKLYGRYTVTMTKLDEIEGLALPS